jgi:hypothetical protein
MTKNSKVLVRKKQKLEVLLEDYKVVFSSEAGQRVLYDLMNFSSMLSTTYQGNVNDMVYSEGSRSVVLHILNKLNTDIQALKIAMDKAHNQGIRDEF